MKNFITKIGAVLLTFAAMLALSGCSGDSGTNGDTGTNSSAGANSMIDPRDGQTYKTVQIGTQIWMAENLNYQTAGSMCYDNNPDYCQKYGRLYTWDDAMNACPSGWHLPNREEFEILIENVGRDIAGTSLKSRSGWNENGNGSDVFGFDALPAGDYDGVDNAGFDSEGSRARFWSSAKLNESNTSYYMRLTSSREGAYVNSSDLCNGLSVRCIKNP